MRHGDAGFPCGGAGEMDAEFRRAEAFGGPLLGARLGKQSGNSAATLIAFSCASIPTHLLPVDRLFSRAALVPLALITESAWILRQRPAWPCARRCDREPVVPYVSERTA
jgi:hypothetical protein